MKVAFDAVSATWFTPPCYTFDDMWLQTSNAMYSIVRPQDDEMKLTATPGPPPPKEEAWHAEWRALVLPHNIAALERRLYNYQESLRMRNFGGQGLGTAYTAGRLCQRYLTCDVGSRLRTSKAAPPLDAGHQVTELTLPTPDQQHGLS